MQLAVELYGTLVGHLVGDARTFDFVPTDDGIQRFGINSLALSVAVPLAPSPPRHHVKRRRNWFAELLPEGDLYDYMLMQAGLRRGDVLAFLARYGRDVAGALQIWDVGDPTEPRIPSLRSLTDAQVHELLEDPVRSPLANDPRSGKSSINGVQPKILLVRDGNGWAQALGGYPTTHILKPRLSGEKSSLIYDEEYGLRLARAIGLAEFRVSVDEFDGLPALVIERYDRVEGVRIQQEDFSQALGAAGNEKYQELGGVVSLKRVAKVLERHTPASQLRILARMVVFHVAIGNLDLHTKNLGLLHPNGADIRLAPAYDVVPQAHMINDRRFALSVNGEYRFGEVTRHDLAQEFNSWGVRNPGEVIDETIDQLRSAVRMESPMDGAYVNLHEELTASIWAL